MTLSQSSPLPSTPKTFLYKRIRPLLIVLSVRLNRMARLEKENNTLTYFLRWMQSLSNSCNSTKKRRLIEASLNVIEYTVTLTDDIRNP